MGQFDTTPVNVLQALMSGVQTFDKFRGYGKERDLTAARRAAANAYETGGDNKSAFARLIELGDTDTIKALRTTDNRPDIQQNYDRAVTQGYKGSLLDYQKELRPPGTNVTVNGNEKSFDQTVGKDYGESFVGMQKAGRNAVGETATLDVLENLTKEPNFYSGVGAEKFALPMKQIISRMGGDPNAAAPMETFRALSNKAVLDTMGGSLGTGFSNADRDFVVGQVSNLANTPEGNRELINIRRQVAKRTQDIARFARDYAAKNNGRIDAGFDAALSDWAEKNPMFNKQSGGRQGAQGGADQPPVQGAKKARDGNWYVPNPNNPGKFLKVVQ
jgi:hypothetical protein